MTVTAGRLVSAWCFIICLIFTASAYSQEQTADEVNDQTIDSVSEEQDASLLSAQIEDIKKSALELNRDLLVLEEDLLFPANTQIAVFLSVDVGTFFRLDAVKLQIDDQLVASHLYTDKQMKALIRGGVQRLYLGNLKTGSHQITAFFEGIGPEEREYKRGATYQLSKDQKPKMLEIRIRDSKRKLQPKFDFKEWQL